MENFQKIFDDLASGISGQQYISYLELLEYREDRHVDLIADQYRHGRLEIRPWLIRYLIDIQNYHSIKKIIELACEAQGLMRERLLDALDRIPDKNIFKIDVLIEALGNQDKEIYLFAIKAMGRARTPKCILKMMDLLNRSDDTQIKIAILNSFENIRDPRSLSSARRCLNDADEGVVSEAVHLIGEVGSRWDRHQLKKMFRHSHPLVRSSVCDVFGRKDGGIRQLLYCLRYDPDVSVRLSSARALGIKFHDTVAWALLKASAKDPDVGVCQAADFSLSLIPLEMVTPIYLKTLASGDVDLCRTAFEQIELREISAARQHLINLLPENQPMILRVGAVTTLGRVGQLQDVKIISEFLISDPALAYAAAHSICQLVGANHLESLENIFHSQLFRGQGIPFELVQVFLRHFSLVARVRPLTTFLLDKVRQWLFLDNSNCAYLALRVLVHQGFSEDLVHIHSFLDTLDEKVRLEARQALSSILSRHADEIQAHLSGGTLPTVPGFWSKLLCVDVPEDQRSSWVSSLALYLGIPEQLDNLFSHFKVSRDSQVSFSFKEQGVKVDNVMDNEQMSHDVSNKKEEFSDLKREVEITFIDEDDYDGLVVSDPYVPIDQQESSQQGNDEGLVFELNDELVEDKEDDGEKGVILEPLESLMGPQRGWAVLFSWIRRWPEVLVHLARMLTDTETERLPILLGLYRVARWRSLTVDEESLVLDALNSDSLRLREVGLEIVAFSRTGQLFNPLIEFSLETKNPRERERSREILSGAIEENHER